MMYLVLGIIMTICLVLDFSRKGIDNLKLSGGLKPGDKVYFVNSTTRELKIHTVERLVIKGEWMEVEYSGGLSGIIPCLDCTSCSYNNEWDVYFNLHHLLEMSPGENINISITSDFWIIVTKEDGESFGIASFGPYVCYTEKHGLSKKEAVQEIHKLSKRSQ